MMAHPRLLLTAVVFALSISWVRAATPLSPLQCNSSRSASLSFSIVSKKNATGHWIAELKMGPEVTDGQHNGGWQIHIDENVVDNTGPEPFVHIKATITAPVPIASPGYEFFPGHGYYKLHTEGRTWSEAVTACQREHAHLAIINSDAESAIIKQVFGQHPALGGPWASAFLGFHDKDTEGKFVTIFGEPLESTGFTKWSTLGAKQPDDAGGAEDCGSVHRNGLLNDAPCGDSLPFFCEQGVFAPSNANTQILTSGTTTTTTLRPQDPDIDVRILGGEGDDAKTTSTTPEEPIVVDEVAAE